MTTIRPYWKPEPKLWDWAFWSLIAPAACWVVGIIIYGGEALKAHSLVWEHQGTGSLLMVIGGELGTLFCAMEVYRKSQTGAANRWDWGGVAVSLVSTLGVMTVIFTRQTDLAAAWIEPVRNWGPLVLLLCSALDFYANVIELGYYRASFEQRWETWNVGRWNHEQAEQRRAQEAVELPKPSQPEPQPDLQLVPEVVRPDNPIAQYAEQLGYTLPLNLSKGDRLNATLLIFSKLPQATYSDIAEVFGVSRTTVGNDIAELEEAGKLARQNGAGVKVLSR